MTIKEVRKKLGISNSWIAEAYGYANLQSYNTSAGKKRIERLIVKLYERMNQEL